MRGSNGRKSSRVFGKARTAVAWTRVQKFAPDAVVHSHALRNVVNVTADRVTEVGDLINKSDLCRKECVSRIFDQLSCL